MFIFTFFLGIYNLKPVALFTNSMKKCKDICKCWQRLEGLRIFHSKNVGEPINIRGVPFPCFNKFVLTQKNFNCFVRYKANQPCCVKTGGDALMKLPCSGLLPSIEVGLCYLRKWRRGKSLLFILKQAQSM